MSETTIKCDQCKDLLYRDHIVVANVCEVTTAPTTPFHFCEVKCLRKWVEDGCPLLTYYYA